jgi:tRNA A-37 threonylcarbamoyl transferase component Bud32
LLEEIERGGMGLVFKARDTRLNRVVALKMILAGPAARREEVIRFQREARAAGQLDHPNILPVYDVNEHDGQHYFTMPFVSGGSLAGHLPRLGADPCKVAGLVEKVARAVHHAHQQGILHRDLKPANILLDAADEPFVADFGLAKFIDETSNLTESRLGLGTPAYMAPEQADPKRGPVTSRTDVWALGVMLYELLAGERPFPGSRDAAVLGILNDEPVRLWRSRKAINPALGAIVAKCLEKDPARRYASTKELADDLAAWRTGRTVSVRPTAWTGRLGRFLWRQRRGIVLVLLLLAALALGRYSVLLYRSSPTRQPPVVDATDPDEAHRQVQERLKHAQAVTLIGPTGEARYARPVLGIRDTVLSPAADGLYIVEGKRYSLVELVADPQCDEFVLRAEMWHREGGTGMVGLYVNHATREQARGTEHTFCSLTFNDGPVVPSIDQGHLALRLWHFGDPWQGTVLRRSTGTSVRRFTPAGPSPAQPAWRTVAAAVSPAGLRVTWGQDEPIAFPRERLQRLMSNLTEEATLDEPAAEGPAFAEPPVFPRRGGLGLFVYHGKASFRNVAILPRGP